MTSIITIVCGPTASGKSARAIDIAQERGGVIINADAMQVYRELHILTARPTPQEERQAPHKLYGILPASEACSAARWLALARIAIDECIAKGKHPVVVGGTGLYLKALMDGLSPIPDIAPELRAQAIALFENHGDKALLEHDPIMSAKLKAGDTQRLVRALEVKLATGKSLAYWQEQPRIKPYPDYTFEIENITMPRDILYQRCNARFVAIMDAGALREAMALHALALPDTLPAMRAVGIRELISYIQGKLDLKEAILQAQQATRNYAKRQMTWFRHQLKSV